MELTVDSTVVDELGHVNNAAYLVFTESIARAHADSVGVTYEAMSAMGRAFVVRKHEATYYGEARVNDVLTMKTWAHSFAGSTCVREVEIYLGEKRIFHCQTLWVWIDVNQRAPKRIPADIVQKFRPLV
jgi:acyl-CoA thioester hydrolase